MEVRRIQLAGPVADMARLLPGVDGAPLWVPGGADSPSRPSSTPQRAVPTSAAWHPRAPDHQPVPGSHPPLCRNTAGAMHFAALRNGKRLPPERWRPDASQLRLSEDALRAVLHVNCPGMAKKGMLNSHR